MKGFKNIHFSVVLVSVLCGVQLTAQTLEWRLINPTFSMTDPDGTGPARGSATFTLQIHTITGNVNDVNTISVGWNYQSSMAMIPTSPGCTVISNPANVSVSPEFNTAAFAFTTVNQCGIFNQTTGGQVFDRRVVGTLDGSSINFTTQWTDVFTVTMWSLSASIPQAGYVSINSGSGGSPAPFSTYAVANGAANEFAVNSLTYVAPLPLGLSVFPVTFSSFHAGCIAGGVQLKWQTVTEENSAFFSVEKSIDGTTWSSVSRVQAAGSSSTIRSYEYLDAVSNTGSFYRLRQEDRDGKYTYSKVTQANCSGVKSNLLIYPVPASDILYVNISVEKNSKTYLKLLDGAGRVIAVQQEKLTKGSNQVKLGVSRLSAGSYTLIIEEDGKVQVRKVVVSH